MSRSSALEKVEAALAAMPRSVAEEWVRQRCEDAWEWDRQQCGATAAAPGIVPQPEFPYGRRHRFSGTARYSCSAGCGWFHEENPNLELPGPWVLPSNFTADDLSAAITAEANARAEARQRRIEDAIQEHFAEVHPDLDPVATMEAAPPPPPSAGPRFPRGAS